MNASEAPKLIWEELKSTWIEQESSPPYNCTAHNGPTLLRTEIPGGWLVSIKGGSLTFVPDQDHKWDGFSLLPAPSRGESVDVSFEGEGVVRCTFLRDLKDGWWEVGVPGEPPYRMSIHPHSVIKRYNDVLITPDLSYWDRR